MQRSYYEAYSSLEQTHWWFAGRQEILLRLLSGLSLPPRAQILNVGSATGGSSRWLSRLGRVRSIEFDWNAARWSVVEGGLRDVVEGSVTALPVRDGAFDLVAALDVIEHVEDDAHSVRELLRVLRPDGRLVVTVPALPALWSQHDVVNRHFRRYTAHTLLALLRAGGVRVLRWSYFNSLLLPVIGGVRLADRLVGLSWLRGPSGSDFEIKGAGLFDPVGRLALASEARLLSRTRLPLGASLVAIGERATA